MVHVRAVSYRYSRICSSFNGTVRAPQTRPTLVSCVPTRPEPANPKAAGTGGNQRRRSVPPSWFLGSGACVFSFPGKRVLVGKERRYVVCGACVWWVGVV